MIIYVNKDDPRIFVYKHQRWRWVGVTLNFAHASSFLILLFTLASLLLPLIPLLVCVPGKSGGIFSIVLLACWTIALCLYYFHRAEKDLERYPGNLSARD
jgi:hypothetical protein